jgi:hypothetical protein
MMLGRRQSVVVLGKPPFGARRRGEGLTSPEGATGGSCGSNLIRKGEGVRL